MAVVAGGVGHSQPLPVPPPPGCYVACLDVDVGPRHIVDVTCSSNHAHTRAGVARARVRAHIVGVRGALSPII